MNEILDALTTWRTLSEITAATGANSVQLMDVARMTAAGQVERRGKYEHAKIAGKTATRWVFRYRRTQQ